MDNGKIIFDSIGAVVKNKWTAFLFFGFGIIFLILSIIGIEHEVPKWLYFSSVVLGGVGLCIHLSKDVVVPYFKKGTELANKKEKRKAIDKDGLANAYRLTVREEIIWLGCIIENGDARIIPSRRNDYLNHLLRRNIIYESRDVNETWALGVFIANPLVLDHGDELKKHYSRVIQKSKSFRRHHLDTEFDECLKILKPNT